MGDKEKSININDLDSDAARSLSENDIDQVKGGAAYLKFGDIKGESNLTSSDGSGLATGRRQ